MPGGPRPGTSARLRRALSAAVTRRQGLEGTTTALRLVDDAADALPGVVVERYGSHAVIFARSPEAAEQASILAEALLDLGMRGVYLKTQGRGDRRRVDAARAASPEPIAGQPAPEPLVVHEGPVAFRVRLGDGHSTGLFLDQRDNRARIRGLAPGRTLLNLFCYTGSFTAAAAVGGARSTVNVDLSKASLARLAENLVENGQDPVAHARFSDDVVPWLARAVRRGQRFDLVVLDPPSFGTRGRGTFSVARDYGGVAADALRLLAPGGSLLAVTNHQGTTPERFGRVLGEAAAAGGRTVVRLEALPMPRDFRHAPGGHPPTKSVLLTVG
jgi:23S rRNA (cytosine1962-C5)-methyltransferase